MAHARGGVDVGDAHRPGRLAGRVVHLVGEAPAGQVQRHPVGAAGADAAGEGVERLVPADPAEPGLAPAAPHGVRQAAERPQVGAGPLPQGATSASAPSASGSAVLTAIRSRRVVQRWTPSMVQSWRPGDTEGAAVARAPGEHPPGVGGVAAVGPGGLGHRPVVVGLLLADAVGAPADPQPGVPAGQLLTQPHGARRVSPGGGARGGRGGGGRRRALGGVDVHPPVAGEAAQRQAGQAGGGHRHRGRGADRHHRGEPGGPRLLDDLEAGPPADVEAEAGGRQRAVEQQPPDHLVDGVVAPDVLADQQTAPVASKAAAAWHGPGGGEQVLVGAHRGRARPPATSSGSGGRRRQRVRGARGARRRRSCRTCRRPRTWRSAGASAPAPGRRSRRSTTLNSLSTAEPVPQ